MPTREEVENIFPEMANRFRPEKAEGLNSVIQFNLSGDNGGLFWIKIADGSCTYGAGESESAAMTMKASADDFFSIVSGTINPMQAFMSGKLKVEGDMGLAMKMQSIFQL